MGFPMWVSSFGNLWISDYVRLPKAYRSLSRPSSAPDAKAFTIRPLQLDLFFYLFDRCNQFLQRIVNLIGFTLFINTYVQFSKNIVLKDLVFQN